MIVQGRGLSGEACTAGTVTLSLRYGKVCVGASTLTPSPPPLPHASVTAGGPPREASPLVDHVSALVRTLEGQKTDRSRGALAVRLAAVASRLGHSEGAQRLATAFGFKL